MADEWQLYYWPNLAGRAEFVRLLFEEAGVKYNQVKATREEITNLIINGGIGGYPLFATPVIKKGNFQLAQTATICRFLGREFGLYPETKEDEAHADQVNQSIHDYIAEGRLAFHGKESFGSYYIQQEETKPYIERFVKTRIPRFLKHFEAVLTSNNGGHGFLFGNKLTYADLGLLHVLRATESQFPDAWKEADYVPLLKSFKDRMSSRQNLAAYFTSDRCIPFEGNSMM